MFDALNPVDGKVTGALAKGELSRYIMQYLLANKYDTCLGVNSKQIIYTLSRNKYLETIAYLSGEMIKSKLPNNVLGKIWKLSDVDRDGMLDSDEFALAMHLMNIKLDGESDYRIESIM
jgi:hypothetical protein